MKRLVLEQPHPLGKAGYSLDELIESFENIYDRLYATEALRERFRKSRTRLRMRMLRFSHLE